MSQEQLDDRLHLPGLFYGGCHGDNEQEVFSDCLSIKGFRGIKELSIERLGRVTCRLLAGPRENSVGKTTVLDAVRVYAARGHHEVLSDLLESRQELAIAIVEHAPREFVADFAALFHGRDVSKCARIAIGAKDADQLRIEEVYQNYEEISLTISPSWLIEKGYTQGFKVVFLDTEQMLPWVLPIRGSDAARTVERYSDSAYLYLHHLFKRDESPPQIGCQLLGPSVLNNEEIARFWKAIALTDDEDRAMQALKLIFGSDLERVATIRDDISYESDREREHVERVVAKLQGQARPVPLQSLGDGALHLAGTALALTNSRDSFLLIDEAENGIHHSVQPDFWRMVFKTAHVNNVQVIATTHSFDCLRGFAQALTECEEVEGALVRLERENGSLRAVEYSERNIKAAAKQSIGIEVR